MFLDQLREAIELIVEKWQSIPLDQKYEIAQYLIPEVSTYMYMICTLDSARIPSLPQEYN